MLLVVIPAAIVGYALAGVIGLAAGAGAVLCIWFLGRMLAPPNEGQTFQEFRTRSSEIYRAQHEALRERRQRTRFGLVRTVGFRSPRSGLDRRQPRPESRC